jgi:GNAT superfamily N-acetyltransferase
MAGKDKEMLDSGRFDFAVIKGTRDEIFRDHFEKIYECYLTCFTLTDEQASREDFITNLKENWQGKPGVEWWVFARDKETGKIAGFNNFTAFKAAPKQEVDGTVHDIYMGVAEPYREQGLARYLMQARDRAAVDYLQQAATEEGDFYRLYELSADPVKLVTFAEQNNPLMMTAEQYLADSEAAEIDQWDRRYVYGKLDHATMGFRYVQPALSEEQEACRYLDLVARHSIVDPVDNDRVTVSSGEDMPKTVKSEIVEEHLTNFFAKSFQKGTSLKSEGLDGTVRDLESMKTIGLSRLDFKAMKATVNVEVLKELVRQNPDAANRRVGELFPECVERLYGAGVTIDDVMESMTRVNGIKRGEMIFGKQLARQELDYRVSQQTDSRIGKTEGPRSVSPRQR